MIHPRSCNARSNFYPRSPCGERRVKMELDRTASNFYPRSPCGERRKHRVLKSRRIVFLSTLSLRRATSKKSDHLLPTSNFYPRSPCGERHSIIDIINNVIDYFYPRSPCGERLEFRKLLYPGTTNFYPRSPCGERPILSHYQH